MKSVYGFRKRTSLPYFLSWGFLQHRFNQLMTAVIEVITSLFSIFEQYPFLARKEKLLLSREEYVLIQMLCFCSEPRTDIEIRSHCSVGKTQFFSLWRHCASRGLLKLVLSEGVPCVVLTERGRNVLQATKKIVRVLARDY